VVICLFYLDLFAFRKIFCKIFLHVVFSLIMIFEGLTIQNSAYIGNSGTPLYIH